jgi:hypothetical protein
VSSRCGRGGRQGGVVTGPFSFDAVLFGELRGLIMTRAGNGFTLIAVLTGSVFVVLTSVQNAVSSSLWRATSTTPFRGRAIPHLGLSQNVTMLFRIDDWARPRAIIIRVASGNVVERDGYEAGQAAPPQKGWTIHPAA